ncbi:unnamed protein product [Bursaphelenchus xylophilus]|uniref:Ribosomal RNA-processing protein 8 n=1 Tax=Bursaphelenchus xylophilus TaxID=6326 RepID=A0A1I7S4K7_BURXY|nr:unnamed protein product [Bursaphelenchus xylophilus]CAG9117205.1 unnamed protein product [Bursaphelenchus xylophilus]
MAEEKVKKRKNSENGEIQIKKKKLEGKPKLNIVEKIRAATGTPVAVNGDDSKKKKRPWRQANRRKAKRQRKIDEGIITADAPIISTPRPEGEKKKRKKKKKTTEEESEGAEVAPQQKPGPAEKKSKKKPTEATSENLQEKLAASQFRFLNEQLYTKPSKDAVEIFKADRASFQAYHKGYAAQVKKWPMNPLDNIILDLQELPKGTKVADMGCGEALIHQKLGSHLDVQSFDLVAANDNVTECDITKTPLKDGSMDVVVYCLSLMGTNLGDFIREANRVLKIGGKLKIAEVLSRFRHVKNFIKAVEQMGFELKKKRDLKDFFVLLTFNKTGKVKQKRPTGLILEPCLYKKR